MLPFPAVKTRRLHAIHKLLILFDAFGDVGLRVWWEDVERHEEDAQALYKHVRACHLGTH